MQLENRDQSSIFIFDIDGTLANIDHRLHYIQKFVPRKWNEFHMAAESDKPIQHMVTIAKTLLASGAEIWFWTGRSDISRNITINWLGKWVDPFIHTDTHRLMMRPANDHRHDDVLKEHWLHNRVLHCDIKRIQCVFEDRTRVVNMWRKNGIPCLQVNTGDF